MISKNFEFLKSYYNYAQYYEDISAIEDLIEKKDKYGIPVEICKLLEKVLKNLMDIPYFKRPLGDLVVEFSRFYYEEKREKIQTSVYNSLKQISNNRNLQLHDNQELESKYEISFTTKIGMLQSLRTVLHYIVYIFEDSDIELKEFNDEIYYEVINRDKFVNLNNDFSYVNDQILINKVSIGDFVLNDKNNFVIPPYQRDYRWTEEECQELLNQLFYKFETDELVYFGTLACKIEQNDDKVKEIRLIDGQQRVTTSLLLFKAFNDVLKLKLFDENDDIKKIAPELKTLFDFRSQNSNEYSDERIKRKYINLTSDSKSNQDGLHQLLTGYTLQTKFDQDLRLFSKSLVIENYYFFRNELLNFSVDKIFDLYNYYFNNFILSCIRFDEENTNEMEIFENLNSKGKELDTFDMIKNYMYNMVDHSIFKERSRDIVNEFEKYFRLNDISKLKGNKDEQNKKYEEFLFNFLTYKNAINNNKYLIKIQKNKKSLLKAFKSFFDYSKISFDIYASICQELGRYFKMYKITRITNDFENRSSELYFARDLFKNLAHKDFSILFFRLIDIYSDYSWNKIDHKLNIHSEDEFRSCLFEIEKWVVFLLQVKGTGQSFKESVLIKLIKFTKLYEEFGNFKKELPEKLKNWFANKISISKDNEHLLIGENMLPTKNEILESLKNKVVQDNNIKNILLNRLENYWLNLSTKAKQTVVFYKPSLEHIIPQKLNDEWKQYLSPTKKWDEEMNDVFREHLNRIGNILILDKSNNSELSNSSFEKKQKSYERSGSTLAKIPFTSKDENLINIGRFGFDQVRDRSAKLAILLVEKVYNV